MASHHTKTFTLIEMLIVIVIIGILAAALVPRLQSVQVRARDSKRKVDLRSINTALEVYRTDFGVYPKPRNNFARTGDYDMGYMVLSYHPQPWISGMDNYMTSMPTDPLNTTGQYNLNIANQGGITWYAYLTGNMVYGYSNTTLAGQSYDLFVKLENQSDPDRCEIRNYYYYATAPGTGTQRCGSVLLANYGPAVRYIYEFSPDSNSY